MLDRLTVVEFTLGFEDSLRVFIKIAFAAQCTEVIRLSSMLRRSRCGFDRDIAGPVGMHVLGRGGAGQHQCHGRYKKFRSDCRHGYSPLT